jgi:hypothetical protein
MCRDWPDIAGRSDTQFTVVYSGTLELKTISEQNLNSLDSVSPVTGLTNGESVCHAKIAENSTSYLVDCLLLNHG